VLSTGVYTVAPTPFHDDGSIDLDSVGRLASFLVELGVEGLLVLGVMGEAHKLLDDERHAVLGRFVEAVEGKAAIVTGTSFPSAEGAAQLTHIAGDLGADAALVSPPRLIKPNLGAVRDYYETVAEASSIEIVIQDHPASSGTYMPAAFIASLGNDIDLARSVKLEDPPTAPKFAEVLSHATRELKTYGGLGGAEFIGELERGAVGTMTGFAFPEVLLEVYRLFESGETQQAREIFYSHLPLIQLEAQQPMSLAIRKKVYKRRGAIASDRVRKPHGEPDAGTLAALDALILDLGLRLA